MGKIILEIKNLTKYYGNIRGVENLSLSLEAGEIFGFIGPNGAGKSTTIRSIMNLINKTEGQILINGQVAHRDDVSMKYDIGYLPSEISLYDDLKVKEILNYHESFYKKDIHNRRKELVKLFQLNESKKVEDLSLGNLKKLGIILAFMHEPSILILDEPTSGLDPIMQQVFYNLLKIEKKKGTTIFYSTHILDEVSKVCDRVGIIKEGHLIKIETVNDLLKKHLTYVSIEAKEVDKMIKDLKIEEYEKNDNCIRFKNSMNVNTLIEKLSKYKIESLTIKEATLEDMFLHYYE